MKMPMGAFCETYGNTLKNRILENLMEFESADTSAGDVARFLGISRPKVYEVFAEFLKRGFIKKTRIVGKTQLYMLNKNNERVRLFLRDFRECLRIIAAEYIKPKRTSHSGNIGAASARNA